VAIGKVGLGEMRDLAQLDRFRDAAHRGGNIVEKLPLLVARHQPEQGARLAIVVITDTMVLAVGCTRDRERRLLEAWVLDRPAKTVGFVIDRAAAIQGAEPGFQSPPGELARPVLPRSSGDYLLALKSDVGHCIGRFGVTRRPKAIEGGTE